MSKTTTKTKWFDVQHPGTINAVFVLQTAELREWIYQFDFIQSHAECHKIPLSKILSVGEDDEFFDFDEDEAVPGARELVQEVIREREALAKHSEELKLKNRCTFSELPFILSKDTEVIVTCEPGVKHGAVITRVRQGYSLFGPYCIIQYRFVVFNGHKFIYTEANRQIGGFSGEVSLRDIGIEIMTDVQREQFIRRGEVYRALNEKPSHMNYSGNLVRRSWFSDRHYRADGRVMVDLKSFIRLDPNYHEFYGAVRNNDDENEADIDADAVLMMTSPYVYGYSLVAKVWGEMRVDQISAIHYRMDAFERLVLDSDRKRIIHALVESNLREFNDIVDNKGGGCIFLLAGPPGVGKTVTAEATAENLQRPLYMVSAGELGTEPTQVEENLKNILDMASTWNAILLVDECDIFLERRTKEDIHRNALVSIFLRTLEYYQGILFLTTNRVGEIDPAFLSRISIALEYLELDAKTREQVWRNLANGYDFDVDFEKLARHKLNGREIKHCLRLAMALAHHEKRKTTQEDIETMIALGQDFRAAINAESHA